MTDEPKVTPLQEAADDVRRWLDVCDTAEAGALAGHTDMVGVYRDARARVLAASGRLLDTLRQEGLA